MGWFSADETVVAQTTSSEGTIIAGALVVMVAMIIIYLLLKVHTKYTEARFRDSQNRQTALNNMRTNAQA